MRPGPESRRLVIERANGLCERCGLSVAGVPYSIHHRRTAGMGGSKDPASHAPSNLLLLDGSGTTGCHGWVTTHFAESFETGLVVSRWQNPAEIPVLVFMHAPRKVLLDDNGRYVTENN